MGTQVCKNCESTNNSILEKNLSNKNFSDSDSNHIQMNYLINNKNRTDKLESNISTKINNNENENNITNYDNPLYNTSLDESMNLGNCYIGTNKHNTKIKPYNPENSLQTVMNKKRLSIEPKNNNNELIIDTRMNKTSKNFNKKKIKYNLLNANENIEEIDEKNPLENGFFYNNSNKKNNWKFDNMGFFNNTMKEKENMDKNLENINKLVKNINSFNNAKKTRKNLKLEDKDKKEEKEEKVSEDNDEEINSKLRKIFLKYNIQKLKKINAKLIKKKLKNIDNNEYIESKSNMSRENIDINEIEEIKDNNQINLYFEEYEIFNDESNSEELDVNLIPEKEHIFIGNKINNLKEGLGLEIFKNSNAYFFGQFNNNIRNGFCNYKINNKNQNYIFQGEVNGINATGYGIYINKETNIKYEGEFNNSMKNGIGIETYKKNFYQGNFVNGKRNGIGEYYWEKDVYYSGEWADNCMNGEGIYKFSKDAWYEGSFKDNKMEGFGILNIKMSKIYVGFFKNDYKDGFGIKIWDNDKRAYVGFWKNNKQEGFGKLFKKDKIKYAIYQDGLIINEINDNEKINKIYNDINKYFSLLFEMRNYEEVKTKVYEFMSM